jgi:hypothetical protein
MKEDSALVRYSMKACHCTSLRQCNYCRHWTKPETQLNQKKGKP